jgi:hypothetical protein
MGQQADQTTAAYKVLTSLVADPAYQKHAEWMDRMGKSSGLAAAKIRNLVQAQQLASGFAVRHQKAAADLARQHELTGSKIRNAAMAKGLADGSAVRQLRSATDLNSEYEQMDARVRNRAAAESLADGSAVKRLKSAQDLASQHELIGMHVRNAAAAESLADGSTVKRLKSVTDLNSRYEQTAMQARNLAAAAGLADGSTVKQLRSAQQLEGSYQALAMKARNQAAAEGLADGSTVRRQKGLAKLNDQQERLNLKTRNAVYAARVADGSEAKRLRTLARANEEFAKMQHRAELVAKYGERWGGVMAKYGGAMNAAGQVGMGVAGAGVATATGLAYQGFQGTVELERFKLEMQMLSREMAGVFKPLMTISTQFARVTRKGMEKTDRGGQEALMWGGLGVAGLLGARLLGVPVGPMAMSGLRGLGGGTAAMGLGRLGVGAAAAYTAYDSGRDVYTDPSTTRGLGRQTARGADVMFGGEFARMLGFKSGGPVGQAYDAIFGSNPRDEPGGGWGGAAARAGMGAVGADGANPARNMVMLAGGGFQETGAAYDRLSSAIEKVEGNGLGGDDTSEEALGPVLKRLSDVLDRLEKHFDGVGPPPMTRG